MIYLVQNEKDKKIEKISKLLEQGGTMLANHCKCGSPLFRYHGNVICPICDSQSNKNEIKKEEEIKKEHDKYDRSSVQSLPTRTSSFQSMTQSTNKINKKIDASVLSSAVITPDTQEFISNMIINKVVELCSNLESETDLDRIKKQLETIGYGIKVLNDILEQKTR